MNHCAICANAANHPACKSLRYARSEAEKCRAIVEILADELTSKCPPDLCCMSESDDDKCLNCWIAWAESQIKE